MTVFTQVLNNFQKIWRIREIQPAWFQIYLFEEPSSADSVLLLLLVNEATSRAVSMGSTGDFPFQSRAPRIWVFNICAQSRLLLIPLSCYLKGPTLHVKRPGGSL